tara:strand:+ start:221 stop:625 length:405 start_codon:yes stop_codon:yes gene_type:complete
MLNFKLLSMVILFLLLSACATQSSGVWEGADTKPAVSKHEYESRSPVISLRTKAMHYTQEGQYSKAEATLERALRIDSEDPLTYVALANVLLFQEKFDASTSIAEKGLALNPEPELEKVLKDIIAKANNREAIN